MKRIILFCVLVYLFGVCWSPADVVPAFKNLKSDINTQLVELFGREISIESVSGTIVNQIELNNVAIARGKKLSEGTIIKAKQIVINYNPFKLATSRGNIVPAISKITIIEPDIIVERSADDRWNMAELIPKVKNDNEKEEPLKLNADIEIRNCRGVYLDHMGWGEPLNGRTFTSKIRDMDARVKIAGNRITINVSATSIVNSAVASAVLKGNVNIKNGKYYFVANIKNVDITKWGYYTMNIPHFKPVSGISDMKLTMTNPPPRKKGQPILFDGQFYIRNGVALIFDRRVENMYGFVSVHDEDARFKNLSGYMDGVMMIANGRLYDFEVANYDIDVDAPIQNYEKLKKPFPQLEGIDFKGSVASRVHIGGNYGHPLFSGRISSIGQLYRQKIKGDLDFAFEGSVLDILPSNVSAFDGKISTSGLIDFTGDVPSFSMAFSSESITFDRILSAVKIKDKLSFRSNVRGNLKTLMFDASASGEGQKEIVLLGTVESGGLSLNIKGRGITFAGDSFGGSLKEFQAKAQWDLNDRGAERLTLEGSAIAEKGFVGPEKITGANIRFRRGGGKTEVTADVTEGRSLVKVKMDSSGSREAVLTIDTASAEAGNFKLIDALVPKELTPVTGLLDAHVVASFELASSGMPDLSRLRTSVSVALSNGSASYEKFDYVRLLFDTADKMLRFGKSRIKAGRTDLSWSGTVESGRNLNIDLNGKLDLGALKPFTIKYGRLFGNARIAAHLEGSTDNPAFNADFNVEGLRYNDIFLDGIEGVISFDGKTFLIEKPVLISVLNDRYKLSGRFDIKKKPAFSIKLAVEKGDLGTAIGIIDEVNKELSTKQIFTAAAEKQIVLDPKDFIYPAVPVVKFFTSDNKNSLSDELSAAEKDSRQYALAIKERVGRHISGKFNGEIDLKGTLSAPSGYVEFRINDATVESYSFDEAFVKGSLENGSFEADSVYIKKAGGTTYLSGTYDPNGTSSIEIKASSMPVDFLTLLLPDNKVFNGTFDMNAGIFGRSASYSGWADLHAATISIGGVAMDDVSSSISFGNNLLFIKNISFLKNDKKTSIQGTIPYEGAGMAVSITMEGEGIGLLTLPAKGISWISGAGRGEVKLTGELIRPVMNGSVTIENAAVYLSSIDSILSEINAMIVIKNNLLTTEGVYAKWLGARTQNVVNKIKVTGSIDLNEILAESRTVGLNIKLRDGSFVVDLPNLYRGDIEIKNASLYGPLSMRDPSKAPKLSGSFDLSDGVISLPDFSKKAELLPIQLDVKLNIGRNNYVVAGDVKNLLSTDVSNLLLNMEVEGQNILIGGTLASPKLTGKAFIKQGTVNILNREFSLMSDERQKEVYPANLEKIKDNTAQFSGGSMPYLNLAAEVNVKETESITSAKPGEAPTYRTTDYLVVSRITGIPYSEDIERGLKLDFDAFIQDTSKQPTELILSGLDQEDIKVLLLPDFIKGPLKMGQNSPNQVEAGDVLADYLNSRLNSYLLRDVERNIAKSLDLESLTLEYNFGKDIRHMLPSSGQTVIAPQGAPETMYGIGAVKGFFDRFYIDMKYAQAVEEQSIVNKALLNYQLTYRLSPVLSVVYYREPFSFIENQSDYYRVTLKAGYQL